MAFESPPLPARDMNFYTEAAELASRRLGARITAQIICYAEPPKDGLLRLDGNYVSFSLEIEGVEEEVAAGVFSSELRRLGRAFLN